METLGDKIMPKLCSRFSCTYCDYNTSKKSSYQNHLMSIKHKEVTNGLQMGQNNMQNMLNESEEFICSCGKQYQHRQGLWRHKKKCTINNDEYTAEFGKEVIIMLLKQNSDLQNKVIELCKESSVTINNNTTNSHNKNINIFLNEHCKDALNIGEFVSSLPLTLEDLENTGRDGYVKGITDIVVRGLKDMDVHKRPIHCSDLKREVMYVKDNDVWQKDQDNVKIKKAIQNIGTRNYMQVKEWVEKYPEAKDINTKKHDQYVQIRIKCTGGSDNDEDDKFQNKILTNISKVVHIIK
jgi:hypothetical protein